MRPHALRSRILPAIVGALGAALVMSAPAVAHPGHGAQGLADGLLHPVTGVDHLLAMVAVGIVAATGFAPRRAWLAPLAFLAGMAVGGAAGVAGLALPGVEIAIVASVVLLGIAVIGAVDGRSAWVVPGLALAGLAHGDAHGLEVPGAVHPAAYVAAFLATTAALHVLGLGVGTVIRDRRAVRVGIGVATVSAGALLVL